MALIKLRKEVKVGLFTAATIAMFLIGLGYLRNRSVFEQMTLVHADFPDVSGLHKGTQVTFQGLAVGQVQNIEYLEDTRQLRVSFDIADNVSVPNDSKAVISGPDFLGNTYFYIVAGRSSVPVASGDALQDSLQPTLMAKLEGRLNPIADKLTNVLGSLDTITIGLRGIVQGQKRNLNIIIEHSATAAGNLAEATARLRTTLARATDLIASIRTTVDSIGQDPNLRRTVANARMFSDSLVASSSDLRNTIEHAEGMVSRVKDILSQVDTSNGGLGKLLLERKTLVNLEASTENLNRLLVDLRRNPKRYVHFSIFGRRDKTGGGAAPDNMGTLGAQ